ncbi:MULTISPECIES: NAD-dependent epimerase/dehydratase family protein [unclassified Candidatus Frackibacter]|uniref:NAD-dependent epimerase/dehydratase family protein n=1 Tax=unclassified Candidatus Frackibacter TaxID=2648818 RepID=UPI00088F44B0|nr:MULTISPECIES: SDR family NAD(P)-dependent oxidoreductase [unclassified Candidatus Frackibacter]SDC07780.1 Nucleoside-diphosphate-sugar epimerase [Candidatus Frackibacter sp. WG11]SEM38668.1 Nucleoside-diphosphate-sugar epimerase [Candidatus Frackibacter sp. WG12]SFL44348.1 Nucleoside-diphosphate-sugar epimerase [Candidatus Frackibacter sp. WG13]
MERVVVTGGTGFVGSNLSRRLVKEGYKVHIISRKSSTYENIEDILNEVEIFEYDNQIQNLIDYFNNINAEVVFHLASLFIAEHEAEDIDGLIDSNLKFGTHILEAMAKSNVKRIINTGTSWQHYKNEEYNPVCLYAATKEAFEKLLEYYVKALDFKAVTLKLFDTYGENDRRSKLINLLSKFAKEKKVLKMSPGEQKLDLVHIEDVVEAFICAYELFEKENFEHEKYGVSSGREIKLKDLIGLYEEITGYEIKVEWGGRPYRKREVMELWSDFETLPSWNSKISLEEGLKRMAKNGNKDK